VVSPVALFVQIALCVHVYRTGRPYWWIWIILMGSLVGCILYAVLEILPGVRRNRPGMINASWFIPKSVIIKRAREHLEESDTVTNRLNLASLLYEYGSKEEAEQTVAECATGVFKDDPEVIAAVAWYKVEVGKLTEAEKTIAQANTKSNKFAKNRIELLNARILFGYKRYEEAKTALSVLQSALLGEEPRYYMALCHWKLGDTESALKVLHNITKSFRKGSVVWRRSEKTWYKSARQTIKEISRTR